MCVCVLGVDCKKAQVCAKQQKKEKMQSERNEGDIFRKRYSAFSLLLMFLLFALLFLDHLSETTWPFLPTVFLLSCMHPLTIVGPGCVPGHLGNPALQECERKYFSYFYYPIICS